MTTLEILAQTTWTKTRRMRALAELGMSVTDIAAALGVGYGFAYNAIHGTTRTGRRAATRAAQPRPAAPAPLLARVTTRPFTRRFGIELEAHSVTRAALQTEMTAQGLNCHSEGYNHSTRPHWKIVSDGSVSGSNAFELVSPVLTGRDGLDDVDAAARALRHTSARVNRTCGFHAHFDANGMSVDHLRRICRNYLRLEGLIDSFMAPSRRGNNNEFCRSINTTNIEARITAATSFAELQEAVNIRRDRYRKLNLTSFYRHGTIEFRQHHGTVNAEKVTFWLRFLHCLIDYSEFHEIPANYRPTTATLAAFCPQAVTTYFTRRQRELAA